MADVSHMSTTDAATTPSEKVTNPEISTNQDELKPPSYLNLDFFENALRKMHPNIRVTKLDIYPAVSVGENYATIVFRANLNTNEGPFPLIVKCIPESENRAKFVNENGYTIREMNVYDTVLPLLQKGLLENNEFKPNIATCYFTIKEGLKDALVFQDMKQFGYRTADRKAGLDYHHIKLALTELAKLHALSVKLRIEKPEMFKKNVMEEFKDNMYVERNREMFTIFLKNSFESISKGIHSCFPFRYGNIADVIIDMIPYSFDWILLEMEINENDVLVLNHGDFWNNNMMFQYKNSFCNIPLNCCMIDFQIARCASPVFDLHYFFTSSTGKRVRDAHMNEFLELYMGTVYRSLEAFGIHKPLPKNIFYSSIDEIKADLKKYALFGFMSATMLIPLVVANKEDAPDMEDMTNEEKMDNAEPFVKLYKNPTFQERYRDILDDFDNIDFFKNMKNKIESLKRENKQE